MRRLLMGTVLTIGTIGVCYAHNPLNAIQGPRLDINKTVIKVPLAKGCHQKAPCRP